MCRERSVASRSRLEQEQCEESVASRSSLELEMMEAVMMFDPIYVCLYSLSTRRCAARSAHRLLVKF